MPKTTQKNKSQKIIALISLMVAIIMGGILFIGATAGWFSQNKTITLDPEYSNQNESYTLDSPTYEQMVSDKKSFIVIAYLPTCTADVIKFMKQYSSEHNISYFYLNWADLRQTSLRNSVGFSPSVILISKGEPIAHLRADSNADIEKYNNYEVFSAWLDQYLVKN